MTILVMAHAMPVKLDTTNYLILNIQDMAANFITIAVTNAITLKDTKIIREENEWQKIPLVI